MTNKDNIIKILFHASVLLGWSIGLKLIMINGEIILGAAVLGWSAIGYELGIHYSPWLKGDKQ